MKRKLLFLDRDGTLCEEPDDYHVDALHKIKLVRDVIPTLLNFKKAGYEFVMVTNQDGLGLPRFPQESFDLCQNFILELFASQGIRFESVHICPHFLQDGCDCRKPKVGMLLPYLRDLTWDRPRSAVIGDRPTDVELAKNLGIPGFQLPSKFGPGLSWPAIENEILKGDRHALIKRVTHETSVTIELNLDRDQGREMDTGLKFMDHMLDQVAKHGGFSLKAQVAGDLEVDDHHSLEDLGLGLGAAFKEALGDKRGIERYGFHVPMDEADAEVLLDLSGRPYCLFEVRLQREKVGDTSSEMMPHFFRSFAESLGANLHIKARGENDHHVLEAIFKALGRTLKQAIQKSGSSELPSTKGIL